MPPSRLALLLAAAALSACSGEVADLPLGAEVTCSSTSDCPSGTVCQPSLGRCVSLAVDDRTAPGLVAGSASITPASAAAGTPVTISFQVDEQLAAEPEIRLTGVTAPLGAPRRNGLSYTLSFPVSPEDGEGVHQVEARLVDVAGNVAATVPVGSVVFDFTPPSAPPPLVTPHFARSGSTLSAAIVFSEPIDGTPTLQIDGGPTLTATPGPGANGFTFARTLDGSEPQGLVDLLLVARDPGGNELRRRYTGAASLDFTSPSVASSSILTPSLRAGDLLAAALRFDEPLGGAPTLVVVAPDATGRPVVVSAVDASTYALSFDVPANTPDGDYALRLVDAADRAGNPVAPQQLGIVTVDSTPPAVSGTIALTPARAAFRAGDRPALEFTVGEDLAGLPTARLETTTPVDAPCVAGTAARTFTCTLSRPLAVTDLPEGTNALQVKLTDAAGNVGYGSRSLVLDYTPPALSGTAFSQLIPGPGNLRSTLSALGPGSTLRVSLLAAEPLAADPAVRLVHPTSGQSLALTRQSANGTSYVYTLTLDATVRPPATWALSWDPVDLAGNRWPEASLPLVASVAVDGETPAAPALGTAAAPAITWERIPWGSEGTQGTPRYTVAGSAASVPGADLVVAWDGSTASAREVGRSAAGASGFSIPLGSDPAELYVSSVDGAGNESPRTRVVDVIWTAGLSGKVPGSTFENPHRLVRRSYSARALSQADDVEIAGSALGLQGDGHLITTSGTGLFRPVSSSSSPPPRRNFSLAYDPTRGRLVLYGGQFLPSGNYPGDTWEWDGQSWRQMIPLDPEGDGNPPTEGYWGMPMVADPLHGGVLLLGPNLWLWNGLSWRNLDHGQVAPGYRNASAAAWDEARGVLVIFGGGYQSDTWEWDGLLWRNVTPAAPGDSPAARSAHRIVYDSAHQRVTLFGGFTLSTGAQNDVWTWNGTRWTPLTTSGTPPSARADAAVAWDVQRGELLVQGGTSTGPLEDGRTYVLRWISGTPTWIDVTPASGTLPYSQHAAARDQASNQVVMVGDETSGQLFAWRGDLHTWTLLSPGDPEGDGNPTLTSASWADMAFNAGRERTVYVDGNLRQTWEWNRASWSRLVNGAGPTQRTSHSIGAYGSSTVLMGGTIFGSTLGDTWVWDGTTWSNPVVSPNRAANPWPSPLYRQDAALVPDTTSSRLYRYGGSDYTSSGIHCFSDIYEWNGAAWVHRGGDPSAWADPEGDLSPTSGNSLADTCGARGMATWHPARGSLLAYADWGRVIWEWLPASNSWVRHAMSASSAFTARAFFYDSTLQAPVLLARDPWTSAPVGWVADLATNTFTPIATANIYGLSLPPGGLASFDPVLGKLVLVDLDSWTWEAGTAASPAHLFHVDYSRANGPDPSGCVDRAACPIQQIEVRWVGGGAAPALNGAMLQVWTGDWLDAQSSTATAASPAAITWSWTPASTFPASGLFHGAARELSFALVPRASTTAAGTAQVATDAVEVTVRYRRP